MRSVLTKLAILILSPLVLAACSEAGTAQMPEGHPPSPSQPTAGSPGLQGEVLETMDSGGYTYVRLQAGNEKIWAAGPATPVQVGDHVTVVGAMEMSDFHSKTLDRTFESLWFASNLVKAGGAKSMAGNGTGAAHLSAPSSGATAAALKVEAGSIPKANDGYVVAELFAKRNELSTQQVSVRGKVVKFNLQIMGKNWIHVQDGTGGPGANDLTVTSDATARIGDIVLIRGTLVVDKDFGAGYRYDVIIEDAQITVED